MLISEAWLREWANPELNTADLCHQITMAGLEVDGVEPAAPKFSGVVVAEIVSFEQHPDADKLSVCQVSDGENTHTIVCGASNVRAGMKAPLARIGAVLPGDFKIKKAKLRGQTSEGMLCAASELGLEDVVDGLLELPADAPLGQCIREYLALDDTVIEVDLTPNRADCLSVRGVAREIAALNQIAFNAPAISAVAVSHDETVAVKVSAPEACPRYLTRVIRNVNPQVASPIWLRERLRRSGLRSVDPIVDVTNYVLLELGQPLHAFDKAKIQGGIEVRFAKQGEKITAIGGETLSLNDKTLVIADEKSPLAVAGITGGEASAVSASTTDIVLECAFFEPLSVVGKAREYGLHTDSSHRFERGVDPALQQDAMERATALILALAGGEAGPVMAVTADEHLPLAQTIALSAERIERLLGFAVPTDVIEEGLAALGMTVNSVNAGEWQVSAPSWRFDIAIQEDLIEEVARLYGYEKLPNRLPTIAGGDLLAKEARLNSRKLADTLCSRGYREVISYAFVSSEIQKILAPELEPLALANPLSKELAVMRSTLWAGLLQTAERNIKRQVSRLRLFEQGLRFVPGKTLAELEQTPMIAGLLYGLAEPRHYSVKPTNVDFYDIKADVEALIALGGDGAEYDFQPAENSVLHPGQSARVLRDGAEVGWVGRIHPVVAQQLDIPNTIYLFELKADVLASGRVPSFTPLSDQPAVKRDLALVLADSTPAAVLLEAIRKAAGAALTRVELLDVYKGENIGSENKSIAVSLTFQDPSRTLKESDINQLIEGILAGAKAEAGASLRE